MRHADRDRRQGLGVQASRRRFVAIGMTAGALTVALTACGSASDEPHRYTFPGARRHEKGNLKHIGW